MSRSDRRRRLADESPSSLSGWLFADLFLLLIVVGFSAFNAEVDDNRPVVRTEEATQVSWNSTVLNGRVTPKNQRTEVAFEWGRDPLLSDALELKPAQAIINGDEVTTYFSQILQDLEPEETYFFRAIAKNAAGSGRGKILSFTTGKAPTEDENITIECTDEGARFEKEPLLALYTAQTIPNLFADIRRWVDERDLVKPKVVVTQIKGWRYDDEAASSVGAERARVFYNSIVAFDTDQEFFYDDTEILPIQSKLNPGQFEVRLYFADFAEKCQ